MSFLAVNGIECPVAVGSYEETPVDIGSTGRAFDGTLRRSRLAVKRECRFETTPQAAATALAWSYLLRGVGEAWSFNSSLYSANGAGPSVATAATIVTTHPKFGASNLNLAITTGTITVYAGLGAVWTVMVWRYESAAWVHYSRMSTGGGTKDGVPYAAGDGVDPVVVGWLTVSGSVKLGPSGAAAEYDDLVVLPCLVPAAWLALWGVAAVAFSNLPRLNLTGDAIAEGGTREALGSVIEKNVAGFVSGAYSSAMRTLAVSLQGA